nr:hypothetical protein CFP56_64777 [Quercus suber]
MVNARRRQRRVKPSWPNDLSGSNDDAASEAECGQRTTGKHWEESGGGGAAGDDSDGAQEARYTVKGPGEVTASRSPLAGSRMSLVRVTSRWDVLVMSMMKDEAAVDED